MGLPTTGAAEILAAMASQSNQSNQSINPYAPPKSDWVHAPSPADTAARQWWLEGDTVVVLRGGSLPEHLCIKTGAPTSLPAAKHKVQWVHPLVAISVISPIIFLILYLIFCKRAELSYAMSPEFIQRRKIGLGLILGPILMFVLAMLTESPAAIVGAGVVFVVSLIVGIVMRMPFQVTKIDKERIHLKVDKRFRAALVDLR